MDVEKSSPVQKSVFYSALMSSASSLLFGMSLTVIGCMYPHVSKRWEETMNKTEVNNLWGITSSNIFLGCLISNVLVNAIRPNMKKALLLNNIFHVTGYIIFLLDQNFKSIFSGRLIIGLGSGITCAIVPIYTSLVSSKESRGFLLSFHPLGICIGITIGNTLSSLNSDSTWRIPLFIALLLVALNFLSLLGIIDPSHQEASSEVSFPSLFKNPRARKSIFLAVLVHISQHLCGVDYITLFLKDLFPVDMYSPEVMTVAISSFSVLVTGLFARYVDFIGRKPLIIASSLISGTATAMLTFNIYPAFATLLFILGYNIGLGPIPWFITAEIFPPEYTNPACLLGVSLNWLSAYGVLAALYPFHLRYGRFVFSFYTFCTILFAGLMALFFTETKNKAPDFQ
ncbi:glucose transporter type 3 [Encephalitozoon intestinalis ATCC 50506]|uniref:Glucose transporter type 3 n=1 Tax=Encephalitozoon intestinalis (strain ATCC 50506) TaxID=876142 RepID=E0S6H2_ENCIT|nr:glucose transporter type 3 [Encephalitozoon intestinalis ATCC 50506]ADM11307.1 glucose transporter type 3 [Encephalitozoon intestinalis ATCC 50506]UTX44993.1 glucose transporter type 3 [Encephalitozoon intestinalis]